MSFVLEDRILKPGFSSEQDLSPGLLTRIGEDPAIVILGFDNKHAEARNEDVIDLRRTVIHLNGDVVHQVIIGRAEMTQQDARYLALTAILECRNAPRPQAAPSRKPVGASLADHESQSGYRCE